MHYNYSVETAKTGEETTLAKKHKRIRMPHPPTKHQLSQWEQQQKRQRIVRIAGVVIIVLAVLIVAGGWAFSEYLPMQKTAIRVNDSKISMASYVDMYRLYGAGQDPQILPLLAGTIKANIVEYETIRQEAAKLGYEITDEEIRAKLEENELPDNWATVYLLSSRMLEDKLIDEYFDKHISATAPQANLMAMLLESQAQADEVLARLGAGEEFGVVAAELSLDGYTQSHQGEIGYNPREIIEGLLDSPKAAEYALATEPGPPTVVSDPDVSKNVGYWIVKVHSVSEDEAEASVILLDKIADAEVALARLEAGDDFAVLAKEVSLDDESREGGGKLDTVFQGSTTPALNEYIFEKTDMELDKPSQPIRDDTMYTTGGYWVLEVLEADLARPLNDDDREVFKQEAFEAWVTEITVEGAQDIEDNMDEDRIQWAIARL
ncbi:peptidylprolyl isomerase [Chloroflexota bacterium]